MKRGQDRNTLGIPLEIGEELSHTRELRLELLLLHIVISQPRWLGHLLRMPPGHLKVFRTCPREETSGSHQDFQESWGGEETEQNQQTSAGGPLLMGLGRGGGKRQVCGGGGWSLTVKSSEIQRERKRYREKERQRYREMERDDMGIIWFLRRFKSGVMTADGPRLSPTHHKIYSFTVRSRNLAIFLPIFDRPLWKPAAAECFH
ncbi:hypothetical protein WMY93_026217 [Mugilogobius chulae]|uniref:Uncharacterized protein n=1 Tax=Mugilogobius chulae TaxID=88201 RepID=A0AAW0N1M8_9GOBI